VGSIVSPPRKRVVALYDPALEQDVLGAMLVAEDVGRKGLAELTPDDFGDPRARAVFRAMTALGDDLAPARVMHRVRTDEGENPDQSWGSYVAALVGQVGRASPGVIEDLVRLRKRRALEDASDLLRKAAEEPDPETGLDLARVLLAPDASANGWRRMSAADLLAATYEEPRWVVPDLLPEGLCIFAARPKAGKSWMALQLAIAVATGGRFFGHELEQGPVLYLALEDGDRRLAKRLAALECPRNVEGICFQFGIPPIGRGGVEYLSALVEEVSPVLVVVDTISRALEVTIDQDRNAGMTAALGPLQQMALDRHLACMLVDHLRKPDGGMSDKNPITEVMGSTAKVGVADTIWGLYRKKGERRAELTTTGRDLEDSELVVDFEAMPAAWQLQGSVSEVGRSQSQQRYVKALRDRGPSTAEVIAGELDVTVQAAREVLRRMTEAGSLNATVRRLASGGRENVYDLASRARARVGGEVSFPSSLSSGAVEWEGQWWEEH
jgi:hypothetical protein